MRSNSAPRSREFMAVGNSPRVYLEAAKRKLKRLRGQEPDPYLPLPSGTVLSPYPGHLNDIERAEQRLAFARHPDMDQRAWQREARQKLAELMGWPFTRPAVTVTRAMDWAEVGPGIRRRAFYLRVRPETDIAVHLLWQEGIQGPAPVYLHLAGSTSGAHVAWGEAKLPIDHQRLGLGADMALQAARKGYLAVAIEQLGFGEREERELKPRSPHRLTDAAGHALLLGRTLMGEKCWDVSAAIDWLLAADNLPAAIDPARINLFGHSSGGSNAFFATALDERITGVLCSGSIGRFRDTVGGRRTEGGELIIPGLLNWLEAEDVAALIAPRPFVGLSGSGDHIFPYSGVETMVEAARAFYARLGAAERINAVQTQGPHRYYPPESWEAWEKWIDPQV
ncbi:alpha/beta hydrolase family protein [Hwanghaeella sp.]|uniref:alpha/beta hydrolase family protein n=1 Tax=Hwanghaeella sp. TaxID=2605943 RepID=UPI003CCC1349